MNPLESIMNTASASIERLCGEIDRLKKENLELREAVGKLQGLLNLQQDIKGNANGQS